MNIEQYQLPDRMRQEFDRIWKEEAVRLNIISSEAALEVFRREFLDNQTPFSLLSYAMTENPNQTVDIEVAFTYTGEPVICKGKGVGPIDAIRNAMQEQFGIDVRMLDFTAQNISEGSDTDIAAYVQLLDCQTGYMTYGAGQHKNLLRASIMAFFSALNRLEQKQASARHVLEMKMEQERRRKEIEKSEQAAKNEEILRNKARSAKKRRNGVKKAEQKQKTNTED